MAASISAADVASRLGGGRQAGDGAWYARCPVHDDKKASLWLKDKPPDAFHLKCHAGCDARLIRERLQEMGLWPRRTHDPDRRDASKRKSAGREIERLVSPVPVDAPKLSFKGEAPTRLYEYKDAEGRLTGYVARWDNVLGEKTIRPFSLAQLKNGELTWVAKGPDGIRDLYNLHLLRDAPAATVLLVEGEKAADAGALAFPRHIVMTWRSGAASAEKTDFSPLIGRDVVLWPDADDAGKKAMATAARLARTAGAASVREVVLPEDLPKGWDVADVPPKGLDLDEILRGALPVGELARHEGDVRPSVGSGLRPYVVSADALMTMELPEREKIVDPFITTSSLSMIYGPRGCGKTWISITLGISIAAGRDFLSYRVIKSRVVLFIDGEMAFSELQSRIRMVAPAPPENFLLLPSESLFNNLRPINLHSREDQVEVEKLIDTLSGEGRKPEVIILDNLSSLSGGVDENDNSALDQLLHWMIKLRHSGLAVVLIHHAGKNGTQRGASRREDLLDTSISLTNPPDDTTPHQGAHLLLRFVKTRGVKPEPNELELRLTQNRDQLDWHYGQIISVDRATELLRIIWERQPETQSALAQLAGVKEAAISHQMKKLRKDGYISEGGPLKITPAGLQRLIDVWPYLEVAMLTQGDLPLGKLI